MERTTQQITGWEIEYLNIPYKLLIESTIGKEELRIRDDISLDQFKSLLDDIGSEQIYACINNVYKLYTKDELIKAFNDSSKSNT